MSADSVCVTLKSSDQNGKPELKATINCPICGVKSTVFHRVSTTENGSWNMNNFDRHLKFVHRGNLISIQILWVTQKCCLLKRHCQCQTDRSM